MQMSYLKVDTAMKMYLFFAILVYKCSNYFSCAEYELADTSQPENDPAVPFTYNAEGNADYANHNGLVFELRRSIKSDNTEIEARRRSALDKNFMRFGRGDGSLPRVSRASKPANLMRFGRVDRSFMRFGRLPSDVPYSLVQYDSMNARPENDAGTDVSDEIVPSKRASSSAETTEISESGEQIKPKQIVYYRRESPKNLMRFGKRSDAVRFLRPDRANLMRFGRASRGNLLRFGRSSGNLMRFGRSKGNMMRFGRSDPRFLRLVKMDNNFMRFGRSDQSLTASRNNATGSAIFHPGGVDDNSAEALDHDRMESDKNNEPQRTSANSDEDYEVHLQEEDILTPIYLTSRK